MRSIPTVGLFQVALVGLGLQAGKGFLPIAAEPVRELSNLEEHGHLFATERRKASAPEEARLTGDSEQFFYTSLTRTSFTKLNQSRRQPALLEIRMHGQAPYFRQPLGVNLEGATADDPIACSRHEK